MNNEEKTLPIPDLIAYFYAEVCERKIGKHHDNLYGLYHYLDIETEFEWLWFDEFYNAVKNEVDYKMLHKLCGQVLNFTGWFPRDSIPQKSIKNIMNLTTGKVVELWEFLCSDDDDNWTNFELI